jgi:hypothetical protein
MMGPFGTKSNHESGQDNIGRVVTDVHDVDANIKILIDNMIMFRSKATKRSLGLESQARFSDRV